MQTVRLILATGEVLEMPSATLAYWAAKRVCEARGWGDEGARLLLDMARVPDDTPVAGYDGALATVEWEERWTRKS